jgi:hypothetical protein
MHGMNNFKEIPWRMFGPETNWQDGENYVIGFYKVCTLHHVVSGLLNQARCDWQGMGEIGNAYRVLIGDT